MFDIIIQNSTIIDGTGSKRFKSDIGILNGKISAIGNLKDSNANRFINATNLIVSPGFIDMHTHSDVSLLVDPGGESKAYQGVTTEVTGNCSYSTFPAGKAGPEKLQEFIGQTLVSNKTWTWNTLDDWANDLENNGISINVVPQLGQAALQVASGATEDRPASESEMKDMKYLAAEAIEQGAYSLSTGLSVAPSAYSSTAEIIELCKAISHYEGVFYVTHARVNTGNNLAPIEEAIEIGVKSNIPVQFSHLAITDRRLYGQGESMIDLFEKANDSGLDITYDMYPYTAAGAGLNQTIPLWAQAGTLDKYMSRLKDPNTRRKIREEVAEGIGGIIPLWDTWKIAYINNESNKHLLGLSVEEIAKERNVEPAEAVLQLVEEEKGSVPTRVHNRVEGDVRYFMSHKLGMIGSDGRAMSTDGFYKKALPHPRYYGTHPRILGRYVREKPSVLTLEDAIYKMTGFPAQRLNLQNRGTIEIGKIADIVIFNPDEVIDKATFEEPHQYAAGIPFVLVKGIPIVDKGVHTQASPGKVLRRGQKN